MITEPPPGEDAARPTPPRHPLPTMIKAFSAIFVSVFLAEIGDKTQLATMLFASESENKKWIVFAASARAAVLAPRVGLRGQRQRARPGIRDRRPGRRAIGALRQAIDAEARGGSRLHRHRHLDDDV